MLSQQALQRIEETHGPECVPLTEWTRYQVRQRGVNADGLIVRWKDDDDERAYRLSIWWTTGGETYYYEQFLSYLEMKHARNGWDIISHTILHMTSKIGTEGSFIAR